jgi:membrane protease YdiL (CAAX protease family)
MMTDEQDPNLNVWANRDLDDNARQAAVAAEVRTMDADMPPQLTADQIQQLPPRLRPSQNRTLYTRGRFVRPWGLRHALYALIGLVLTQVVAVIGLFAIATSHVPLNVLTNPDPNVVEAEVMKQLQLLLAAPWVLLVLQMSMYIVWVGIMLWATYRKGLRSFAKDFWVRFRWYDPLLGIAIAWGLLALSQVITTVIEALYPNQNYSGLDNGATLTNFTGIWFWVLGIGVVGIIGPLCEELFFRGLLMQGARRWLARYFPTLTGRWINVIALIVSSIAFGSVHLNGVANFGQILVPFLTGGIGVVLGFIVLRSKRMGINIFTHMAFNTTSVILGVILASH